MSTELRTRKKVRAFARQAHLASLNNETLLVAPETAGLLATYLQETLAVAEDQAWFWSKAWQAAERESENDLSAEWYQAFDTMEDLLDDLGWPQ
ncbi:MAG: hypothetical protein MUC51_18680 [Anaerolineae bacterium]|nr:hypothetical protein [Anaerolineae bacterium]